MISQNLNSRHARSKNITTPRIKILFEKKYKYYLCAKAYC